MVIFYLVGTSVYKAQVSPFYYCRRREVEAKVGLENSFVDFLIPISPEDPRLVYSALAYKFALLSCVKY